jgi:hypothetical protein
VPTRVTAEVCTFLSLGRAQVPSRNRNPETFSMSRLEGNEDLARRKIVTRTAPRQPVLGAQIEKSLRNSRVAAPTPGLQPTQRIADF